jgi:adenosylhomocysteine nucleosidase
VPPSKAQATASSIKVAVLISALTEWRYVCAWASHPTLAPSPYGDWFIKSLRVEEHREPILFLHGGWGKIDAAASTQYVIDRWTPKLIVNLGTCGGFQGVAQRGDIVLAERTLIYDIVEQMGDPDEALAHYTTDLDLSWLSEPYPQSVRQTLLISADRDLIAEEIPALRDRFSAVAGDWESGAIAHVATQNGVRCLILRGVTDLVGPQGGEAYDGTLSLFSERTACVMTQLLEALPSWLSSASTL